jgi:hypothetical protein
MTAKGFNEVILKNDYYSRELVFKVGPEAPDLISTGDYDDANPIPGTVQTISNINIYVDKGRSTYDHCPPMSP